MNGLDKITERIDADAKAEAGRILADAQAKADAIAAEWAEKARRETDDILARGKKNAAERQERLASVARLEGRKKLLGAKQEMLGKAFDRALEQLLGLPEEEYVELRAAMAAKASVTGRESVAFSKRDRSRVGKQVVTRANEILARRVAPKLPEELTSSTAGAILDKVVTAGSALLAGTGMLTLAEETRPIRGGFILAADGVEMNCAFETLVRLARPELERQVADVLFVRE